MKKLLAFVLVLGLAVSTSVTAFAEDATTTETNDSTKSTEIAVNGSYQAATPAGSSISVDVMWEDMSFTYTGASKGAWDPKTHEYGADIPAHWAWSKATEDKTAPNITLTNHSDTGVKAKFVFTPEVNGLTGTFTGVGGTTLTADNALTLATALKTDPDKAPSAVTSFSVGGSGIDSNQRLGSIIVTVAKDGATTTDTPQETVEVGSETALQDAIAAGKSVKLTSSLTLNETLDLNTYSGTIDLNGQTLTFEGDAHVMSLTRPDDSSRANVTINNGTIQGNRDAGGVVFIDSDSNVTMNTCTIINESASIEAVQVNRGTVVLNNCTLTNNSSRALYIHTGDVTLSGTTIITADGSNKSPIYFLEDQYKPTCLAGTYNFNPTDYVDTNKYTVTQNADGTWTVAEGATGGDTSPNAQVGNEDALRTAVEGKKETITLTANISLENPLYPNNGYTGTIDLNNHTLSNNDGDVIGSLSPDTFSIKNGTLASGHRYALSVNGNTTVTVDNCTIQSEPDAALFVAGTAALHNCTIQSTNYAVALRFANNGHLTLSGITNITGSSVATNDTDGSTNNSLFESGDASSLTCLAGTYNFDPTPYVNTGTYNIIRNPGANTWTVTTGESTGEETPTTPGITTFEKLKEAIDSSTTGSEVITLGGNIDAGKNMLIIPNEKEVTIDLGGYTLTCAGSYVIENRGTVTIKNGKIESTDESAAIENYHSLTAENLTVNKGKGCVIEANTATKTELKNCNLSSANSNVIRLNGCGAEIVDCTLTSSSDDRNAIKYNNSSATATQMITIGGNTTVDHYIVANTGSTCYIYVQDGCSFDPAQHYDENTNTLTKDDGGIWTLKYGTNVSTDSE